MAAKQLLFDESARRRLRDGVDALAHAHDGVAVAQVAQDDFLVRRGRAEVGHVGQAHDVGEFVQALAQAAAQVTGGAGEQDAFEWFRHL